MQSIASSSNATLLKKPKSERAPKTAKPSSSAPPLGKFLASSEKPVRDKAVAALSRFLAGKKHVEGAEAEVLEVGDLDWEAEWVCDKRLAPFEMAKLWKGIFFCFWMSDKPLVQQSLAKSLSLLILSVRPKKAIGRVARFRSAMCYLKGFWESVVREWGGLDRLRLDKFYLLIRRFVHTSFLLLAREEWDLQAIAEYNAVLTGPGGPLHVLDSRIPHSLCYHLADIYVDEINAVLTSPLDGSTLSTASDVPLLALLEPFFKTIAIAPSSTMFTRISTNVFVPLFEATLVKPEPLQKRRKVDAELVLPEYPGIMNRSMEGVSLSEDVKVSVGQAVLAEIWNVGGRETTGEVNRRRMYALHRIYNDDAEL